MNYGFRIQVIINSLCNRWRHIQIFWSSHLTDQWWIVAWSVHLHYHLKLQQACTRHAAADTVFACTCHYANIRLQLRKASQIREDLKKEQTAGKWEKLKDRGRNKKVMILEEREMWEVWTAQIFFHRWEGNAKAYRQLPSNWEWWKKTIQTSFTCKTHTMANTQMQTSSHSQCKDEPCHSM